MEFVEEVLSWVGDLSSGSHGCDELALEPHYEYYQEPEPYREHEHEHEHEPEENDEQPAGEDQKEEGRSSSNDKKHMKNAAALGLGKAKVGAEKVKGKINWIKEVSVTTKTRFPSDQM